MMDTQTAERIAAALEKIVEKLTNIESKIEELSYEVQSQGNMICDAMTADQAITECDN